MHPGKVNRLPVVGVLGSGTEPCRPEAGELGAWLAGIGVHLLTGGGGGVMESVSRGFCGVRGRKGLAIGIIPARAADKDAGYAGPKEGYPNTWIELAIQTHLQLSGTAGTQTLSRNHINILSSDVLIALAGGAGTASEVRLAFEKYHKPLIAYVQSGDSIPDLPTGVRTEADPVKIREFVLANLATHPGFEYAPSATA